MSMTPRTDNAVFSATTERPENGEFELEVVYSKFARELERALHQRRALHQSEVLLERTSVEVIELAAENARLAKWKLEMLTLRSWWKEIDSYVRAHPSVTLGDHVSHAALRLLRERDAFERELRAKSP